VQCALISEVYNRGEAMAGNRRAERRRIRDDCLPAQDAECVARALEASCRVWANDSINGAGLCARRRAEAAIARGPTP
jgi:GH24 family phage-related lysozyme (muramidase)